MSIIAAFFKSFICLLKSPFESLPKHKDDWPIYWREKVLNTVTISGIYIGILLYVPALIWDMIYGFYGIAAFNTCIFSFFVIVALSKQIKAFIKSLVFSLLIYLIGVVITMKLGSIGGGTVWIFAFPIAAGLLINLKAAWYANILNICSLFLLGLGIRFGWFHGNEMAGYDLRTWIVISINIAGLSGVCSITIGILLKALDRSIAVQRRTQTRLKEEKMMLQVLKEKAEHADKLKSSFLANVSHELRTPLNAIIGFSDILMRTDLPKEKTLDYIRIIHERGHTLMHLFNDIIDISRIEANQLEIKKEHVNLTQLLGEVYELYELIRMQQGKDGVDFICHNRSLIDIVSADLDPFRLKQVLSNLLTNAFKFTSKGKIEFGVERAQNAHLLFYVKDTGTGIPHERQPVIFEPYVQADDKIKYVHGGFGLGLSICRSLVEMMEGQIWVESEPGKGSSFFFTLPMSLN